MSMVRPVSGEDVEQVADLFQRVLRRASTSPPPSLTAYLRKLYLDSPEHDAAVPSLVYALPDGRVGGFIGVQGMPMSFQGRRIKGALFSALMVDHLPEHPFAGALLLRTAMAGPQDVSMTVTANELSTRMWMGQRASLLRDYSLDWLRIIRPARMMVEFLSRRIPAARLLRPAAGLTDALFGRLAGLYSIQRDAAGKGTTQFVDSEIDDATLIELIPAFTRTFDVAPQWGPDQLRAMLADAALKPDLGPFVRRVVRDRQHNVMGAYAYHGRSGRIGQVLQIFAMPGKAGAVIDSMVAHAADAGLVALRGRTQPHLIDDMVLRRFIFMHTTSSLVSSRDASVLASFQKGSAFLNGLAGEAWTRISDGRFD